MQIWISRSPLLWSAVSALAVVSLASQASALDKCKARISKRDGTITVGARGVTDDLRWGWSSGESQELFDNASTCISGTTAKGCTLGAEGDPRRITPPPSCTLHLRIGPERCEAPIPRCTVAARPICPPYMEQVGSWCIQRAAISGRAPSNVPNDLCRGDTFGLGRRDTMVCPLEALVECDTNRTGSEFPSRSCGELTDPFTSSFADGSWTMTPFAGDGDNVFGNVSVYRNDNTVQTTNLPAGLFQAYLFCCQRLGGY